MKPNEKLTALLLAYIELAQNHYHEESQIIVALLDIFDEKELCQLCPRDFIEPYLMID